MQNTMRKEEAGTAALLDIYEKKIHSVCPCCGNASWRVF